MLYMAISIYFHFYMERVEQERTFSVPLFLTAGGNMANRDAPKNPPNEKSMGLWLKVKNFISYHSLASVKFYSEK